jgi:ribonuclease P protein subunit POP4
MKKPARDALIGQDAEVIDAKNKTLIGIKGTITDETKNTLEISTKKGNKKIIKGQVTIRTDEKTIEGKSIQGRTETRIKQERRNKT